MSITLSTSRKSTQSLAATPEPIQLLILKFLSKDALTSTGQVNKLFCRIVWRGITLNSKNFLFEPRSPTEYSKNELSGAYRIISRGSKVDPKESLKKLPAPSPQDIERTKTWLTQVLDKDLGLIVFDLKAPSMRPPIFMNNLKRLVQICDSWADKSVAEKEVIHLMLADIAQAMPLQRFEGLNYLCETVCAPLAKLSEAACPIIFEFKGRIEISDGETSVLAKFSNWAQVHRYLIQY